MADDPGKPAEVPGKKPFNWPKFQAHMGYTDEQMAEFKADDRKRRAAEAIPEANRKTIVATVIQSHACAAGFKEGDTIEVTAAGIVKSCNVCIYAIAPMTIHAAMAHDRIASGLDPNDMWFNHFSCQDAGFCNGSWGQVSFKVEVK